MEAKRSRQLGIISNSRNSRIMESIFYFFIFFRTEAIDNEYSIGNGSTG